MRVRLSDRTHTHRHTHTEELGLSDTAAAGHILSPEVAAATAPIQEDKQGTAAAASQILAPQAKQSPLKVCSFCRASKLMTRVALTSQEVPDTKEQGPLGTVPKCRRNNETGEGDHHRLHGTAT